MPRALAIGCGLFLSAPAVWAQCSNYQITVGGGNDDGTIFWQIFQVGGGVVASGGAPITQTICLPDGCYYMNMYDDVGDGWGGATYTIKLMPAMTMVASGTLPNGFGDIEQVPLGSGCLPGCALYQFGVSTGTAPMEVSWSLVSNGVTFGSGGASSFQFLCLDSGCYVLNMFDSGGNGWNGATWSMLDGYNGTIGNGTLTSGSSGQHIFAFGVPASQCGSLGPMDPSDCETAMNVCADHEFSITANGYGTTYEVPPLGSVANPDFVLSDGQASPWATDNWGCLRVNEHNSTWMIVNIAGGGSLEFTMGAAGAQSDYYDWAMYPYDANACAAIMSNTLPPVRCNWNDVPHGGTGLASALPPGGDANNYEPPINVTAGQKYVICFSNYGGVTDIVPMEFGGTAVVGCSTVLPVELLSFTGTREGEVVHLRWTTATERNMLRFDIERADASQQWGLIGQVPAAGDSQQQLHYELVDAHPSEGLDHYRLGVIDIDGSREVSDVVAVWMEGQHGLIHPNPSDGPILLPPDVGEVHVFDATGREVAFRSLAPGGSMREVSIASPGVYSVLMDMGGKIAVERLVIW
jgi:hypothetical protein